MEINYVAFAIPAFFIFLGLEYAVAIRKGKSHLFKYENSASNISVGIAERLLNLLITGSFYSLFYYVYNRFAILSIPNHWIVWMVLLLATDLVWYWYHRMGHEINLFWGAHIVHHQSEEFNYTVSARITTLQAIVRNLFWCILPIIGFHPSMVIAILVVHGTYSFFTHTQLIGKLGWLEHIFITPSHHGVHHASNEKYLNKNYGDIFVFWDKMFGTFQKEEERPVFGLTHPLKSHSFLWQHFHYYMELWAACRKKNSVWQVLKIIFGRPEDIDQSLRVALEKKLLLPKAGMNSTFRFKVYLNVQLVLSVIILFAFTLLFFYNDPYQKGFVIAFILLTLVNCGAMLEQQKWIHYLELSRLILLCGFLSYTIGSPIFLIASLTFLFLFIYTIPAQQWYYKFVYNK
ncbi:MAG: sterol desaturase family protein [Cyclobacteriaceae bacterium]|nr:sterol desaturase family protein [Cyclobacteriaceae bacterium]